MEPRTVEEQLAALKRDLASIDTDNPAHELCARCGGVAIGDARIDDARYCHGELRRPTCYEKGLRRAR